MLVVSGGSGSADNYTFIQLSNGNQLKLKSLYQVFQGYYETLTSSSISSGKLTIDPSEGSGSADNYTFIQLSNGNQLKLKSLYQVFQGYYETLTSSSISSGKLTIDPSEGSVTKLTVTEEMELLVSCFWWKWQR